MADPGWNFHKAEIERLYVQENHTRDEVMNYMATNHSWKKRSVEDPGLASPLTGDTVERSTPGNSKSGG